MNRQVYLTIKLTDKLFTFLKEAQSNYSLYLIFTLNGVCMNNEKNLKDIESNNRREFLKKSVITLASITAVGAIGGLLYNRQQFSKKVNKINVKRFDLPLSPDTPNLVVAKGELPKKITQEAIKAIGGIEKFISKQDIVLIKPNIGWDRTPEQAANTNPEVVSALIEMCFNAGAKEVRITDVPCTDPRRALQRSGIGPVAEKMGAKVIIPEDSLFKDIEIGGKILNVWPVLTPTIEVDKVINVPVAKHHGLSGVTLGMKNLMGFIGGKRNQLHQDIHTSLTDLADFIRPTLIILDAVRALVRNGPQGGSIDDVVKLNTVVVSTDQVALDAYGITLFKQKPKEFPFIEMAYKRGIGQMHLEKLNIKEIIF